MTSEQKLLQLIRRSPKERKMAPVPLSSTEAAQQGWMTERAWFLVNRILMVVVVMMLAGLAWRYKVLQEAGVETPVVMGVPKPSFSEVSVPAPQPSFDEIRSTFSSRNVFQVPAPPQPVEEVPLAEVEAEVVVPKVDLNQQYRIVGVALGAQPTVIIENIQTSSTMFLGIGDKLDEAVVKEILENRVILELNGQKVELKS